jgi:hypothetical protein
VDPYDSASDSEEEDEWDEDSNGLSVSFMLFNSSQDLCIGDYQRKNIIKTIILMRKNRLQTIVMGVVRVPNSVSSSF